MLPVGPGGLAHSVRGFSVPQSARRWGLQRAVQCGSLLMLAARFTGASQFLTKHGVLGNRPSTLRRGRGEAVVTQRAWAQTWSSFWIGEWLRS
jgi:hypothetical protein